VTSVSFFLKIRELGDPLPEGKLEAPGHSVPLLADRYFRDAINSWSSRDLLVGYEEYEVCILLDGAAFPQVAELRPAATGPLLDLAVQLRDRDDWDVQFLCEVLQPAADLRHLLGAVLVSLARSGHELQVVHNEEVDPMLQGKTLGFCPDLQHGQVRGVVDVNGGIGEAGMRAFLPQSLGSNHLFPEVVPPQAQHHGSSCPRNRTRKSAYSWDDEAPCTGLSCPRLRIPYRTRDPKCCSARL
jgi:hypothetical protein